MYSARTGSFKRMLYGTHQWCACALYSIPRRDYAAGCQRMRGMSWARQYQRGHTVKVNKTDGTTVIQHFKLEDGAVVLAPDVREYFSDADSVNQALRTIIGLIPQRRRKATRK